MVDDYFCFFVDPRRFNVLKVVEKHIENTHPSQDLVILISNIGRVLFQFGIAEFLELLCIDF